MLRKSSLHDRHRAAGAKLVPFAGWEMPLQYADVKSEHLATRTAAGMFDVSHMGEIATSGPQAEPFLQSVLSNDVSKLEVGGAQYALVCNEDGGVLDDVFTYRLGTSEYLTVTNAANHEKDVAWFRSRSAGFDVRVEDVRDHYSMLAIQGPDAREVVSRICDGPLPGRFRVTSASIAGTDALICGTGYTGEDGVEVLCAWDDAVAVWDALAAQEVSPVGLAARDTLRLEVCYCLYGNDLMESRGPIEAGLGWACKEDTGFIGSEAVRAARERGTREKLVPFVMSSGIARQGNSIVGGGEVTSGTMSPSLGMGIGMAYVPTEAAQEEIVLEINVRGRVRRARVASRPLYRNGDR